MALTLAEATKLSNDLMLQGVIQTIIKDSPILQRLPFIEIVGNGLTYNRENVAPTVNWYDVNDTWAESTPTFTQITAVLRILGGDADVDNFISATRSNINNYEAAVIALKAKAVVHEFEETFLYGLNSANPKRPDGLREAINLEAASDQVIAMAASGASLTLAKIDELLDAVKGGPPELLLMSKRSRRKMKALARAAGTNLQVQEGYLGQEVLAYGDIPIGITDWQLDTHTVSGSVETGITGSNNSVIYAVRFGEGALAGISGPGGLQVVQVGQLETKDALRHRIKWYVNPVVLFNAISVAALIGVQD